MGQHALNGEEFGGISTPKRISLRKQSLKRNHLIHELELVELNEHFLNELLIQSFKLNLVLTGKWFLLSDWTMVLSDPFTRAKYNKVTRLRTCDKYQRLYLKQAKDSKAIQNPQTLNGQPAGYVMTFELVATIPL